jgi:hypothetical protein
MLVTNMLGYNEKLLLHGSSIGRVYRSRSALRIRSSFCLLLCKFDAAVLSAALFRVIFRNGLRVAESFRR